MKALTVLYQDGLLVAVNKPAGLMVHSGHQLSHGRHNVIQTLNNQFGTRHYAVHRLDKPTSGVLLLARDQDAASQLAQQWQARSIEKRYLAVCRGFVEQSQFALDAPMAPPTDRFAKNPQPQPEQQCITEFQRLAQIELPVAIDKYPNSRYSLLEALPVTGRKHQIRRHLRLINHPILRDGRYGKGRHSQYFRDQLGVEQMLLHAWQLSFEHPLSGERLTLNAPLDEVWLGLLQRFGWSEALPEPLRSSGS